MLELRSNRECCDRDLPATSGEAFICTFIYTFECTFCADCARAVLNGKCPNCTGNLTARPSRPAHLLAGAPGSTKRILRAEACPGMPA